MESISDVSFEDSLEFHRKGMSGGTGTAVATDDGLGNAIWDYGDDDMSMEMVTDIDDGDVDEEVRFCYWFSHLENKRGFADGGGT
jgi:hypothetical protein